MRLGNMREQGVCHLIAYCHNDACRHQGIIDVSSYSGDTPVPWFRSKVKCAKCGTRNNRSMCGRTEKNGLTCRRSLIGLPKLLNETASVHRIYRIVPSASTIGAAVATSPATLSQ
jgi:transposase